MVNDDVKNPAKGKNERRGSINLFLTAPAVLVRVNWAQLARAEMEALRHAHKKRWLFRIMSRIYTERKTIMLFIVHFVATMSIWAHFFYLKYDIQEHMVPVGANRYWWKRLIPPLEFGAMHAILFQMALLPVTMCRRSLSILSDSILKYIIPFNRIVALHIHLGYTMSIIVGLATCVFFIFFGTMCEEQKQGIEPLDAFGDRSWCMKFESEIMCTGYGILGSLLLIAVTSYLRDSIPYELFYGVHHLVFCMFALAMAHTVDDEQRKGVKDRSQVFKWVIASLWLYSVDRFYGWLSGTVVFADLNASVIGSDWTDCGQSQMRSVMFKVPRPVDFLFDPGQWVYLNIPAIDRTGWHPFSIGSDPTSKELVSYKNE
jgi:hypothetical protein